MRRRRTLRYGLLLAMLAALLAFDARRARAHGGAPILLVTDSPLARVGGALTVWADPDVPEGVLIVEVSRQPGLGDLALEGTLAPEAPATDPTPATVTLKKRADGKFAAPLPLPHEGRWQIALRASANGEEDTVSVAFDTLPPGLGAWDLALFAFPFVAIAGLAAAVLRRRPRGTAVASA
jgi:hypothetical protein